MVFTIFVWFEGKIFTLDSVLYPTLSQKMTVREMKKIVSERLEMIIGTSKIGYSVHIKVSCGKFLEKDPLMIWNYGLSNMGTCCAYFRPYNKNVEYDGVKYTLEWENPEDILDMIKSCRNNKFRRTILLTRKFNVYTNDFFSFWGHILAREFCSLMVPCVRLGMPVNQRHKQYSALSIALYNNNMNVVRELLLLGANPSVESRFLEDDKLTLMTPLQCVPVAVSMKIFSEETGLTYLQLLIDSNADLSVGKALVAAVGNGQQNITQYLVRKGCNLEARDYYSKTPLMTAIWREDIYLARLLHLGGASPNVRNPNMKNFSPFMQAVTQKNLTIMSHLVLDPANRRNEFGDSLWECCRFTDTIIDVIWSMVPVPKVDFSLTDEHNRTVFDIADTEAIKESLYKLLDYL